MNTVCLDKDGAASFVGHRSPVSGAPPKNFGKASVDGKSSDASCQPGTCHCSKSFFWFRFCLSVLDKMRVIRAVAALNSGRTVGSRQVVRYAGLGCRVSINTPSAQCYSSRLSGLRHFSNSHVSRAASSSAAEAAYAFSSPSLLNWAPDRANHYDNSPA